MNPISILTNRKRLLVIVFCAIGIYCALSYTVIFSKLRSQKSDYSKVSGEYEQLLAANAGLQKKLDNLQRDYNTLQGDYKNISLDRDNLFAQAKSLLGERNKVKDLQAQLDKAKNQIDQMELERLGILKEKQAVINQNLDLKDAVKNLEAVRQKTIKEKEQLLEAYNRERDASYAKKLEDEKLQLQREKDALAANLKLVRTEADKNRENLNKVNLALDKANKELNILRAKVEQTNQQYADLVKRNHEFEQKVTQAPAKFAELARQNQVLVKQTANMHYNLGVFYTKQKEYSRAAAELEKAVELNPEDAYSHFNLGYIYAEHLINRPKAIEHFKHYLRYAKKDDKDVDWVRKYLLTWQAYQGKEPMQ
jgi:chromosome segregation ATPase